MRGESTSSSLLKVMEMLSLMAEDTTLPKNVRRGAKGAWEELSRESVAIDLRVASAVGILDDVANAVNLPMYGRASVWSVISHLESLS